MKRTATTSAALLGLLSLRSSWSIYDMTKQLRRNMRFFWPRAESRIYDEARTLVAGGLAETRVQMTGRRQSTIYSVTRTGRQQLSRWLATPPSPTRLECEPLLRIFLADFATREQLQAALNQIRSDAEAIQSAGRTVAVEYLAGTAPFQDQVHVRGLVFDFLWSHAEMLRQWADRAEATVDGWSTQSKSERDATALASMREHLDPQSK